MLFHIFLPLLASQISATYRDPSKIIRTIPTISNSLVNLGKMEISFYFNGKPQENPAKFDHAIHPSTSFMSKPEPIFEEECHCSNFRNVKDSMLSNPSEIINKILKSNDLFSKDFTSTLCCDTHEHVEDTVYFEIAPNQKPKQNPINTGRTHSFPSFLFDTIVPNRPMSSPYKPKAVEIYMFPKRKDIASFDYTKMLPKKNIINKDGIRLVGDKVMQNVSKSTNVVSSVKKDLPEKVTKKEETKEVANVKEVNVTYNTL